MSYYCEICLKENKKESKYSHQKFKPPKKFEENKHTKLSLKNVDIKDVDETLFLYMIDHNKKINQYLLKGKINLVLNDNQDCIYITTGMIDNKTCISWLN